MNKNIPWDIIISKLRNELSDTEETSFDIWLKRSENQQLFEQLQEIWVLVQSKTANYKPDVEYYWQQLSARIDSKPEKSILPDSVSKKQIPFKRFYRYIAVASIALLFGITGSYYLGNKTTVPTTQITTQTYSSLTGKSRITLPDGTQVWLHNNTTLSYNSDFKSTARKVTVKGEAFFDVIHDANNPFVVNSNGIQVQVHGTKFNVNSYASSHQVLVSLFEGSVSMTAAGKAVTLKPGEEGCFDKTENSLTASVGDVDYAKSWTEDKLHFENKSLRYVCKYLSKWYSVKIDIDERIPDNQSYTFTVRDEALEEVVRIMARINSLDYQFDKQNELFLKQKHTNHSTNP